MASDADQELLERAKECPHNHACLDGGDSQPQCPVERSIGRIGVFLAAKPPWSCPYHLSWGYSYLCQCPVRRAVYRRHGK